MSVADAPLPGSNAPGPTSYSEGTRERTMTWEDPVATAAAGAEMAGIDYMRALVAGELPPPPIAVTMRMGHRPRPLRGPGPLPRPQTGDRRGDADRGGERKTARQRDGDDDDLQWLRSRASSTSSRTP